MAGENYFELFGLPSRYVLDAGALELNWRALAARVHPDRYATATPAERRVAMQWAAAINEAYRVLKTPLNRAQYLCEQAGCDVQSENGSHTDTAFLLRQMQWREQLEDALQQDRPGMLDPIEEEIGHCRRRMERDMARLIDEQRDYIQAGARVREWMFIEKFAQELAGARSDLNDSGHQ